VKKRLRHFHAGSTVCELKKKKREREREREKKGKTNSKRNIVRYYRIRASISECQSRYCDVLLRAYMPFRRIHFALPADLLFRANCLISLSFAGSRLDTCLLLRAYLIDLIVVTGWTSCVHLLWMFVTRGSSRKKKKEKKKKEQDEKNVSLHDEATRLAIV